MHALAGTHFINIGGHERPMRFGTNQSGKFCSMYNIEFDEYWAWLQDSKKLSNLLVIRDLIYSALWAGARSEKLTIDFTNEDVGDWFDEIEDKESFMDSFGKAMHGNSSPNGNRAQRRMKKEETH